MIGINPEGSTRPTSFQFPSVPVYSVNTVRGWISSSYRSVWADYQPNGIHRGPRSKSSPSSANLPYFLAIYSYFHRGPTGSAPRFPNKTRRRYFDQRINTVDGKTMKIKRALSLSRAFSIFIFLCGKLKNCNFNRCIKKFRNWKRGTDDTRWMRIAINCCLIVIDG